MTVYNMNQGIGWASSGVEYAQMYRMRAFQAADIPSKFVYTDFISNENIGEFTKNLGFDNDDVIWLYQFFSDIPVAETTYQLEDVLKSFEEKPTREEKQDKVIRYFFEARNAFYTVHLSHKGEPYVHFVEYVSNGYLLRRDFFTTTKVFSEYYRPLDGKALIYQRNFFNQDGSIALSEIIEDPDKSIFRVGRKTFYYKEELISYFLKCLDFSANDVIIIDRAAGMGRAILENRGKAKVGVVIHADHYSKNMTDDDYILWNNYYEYEFQQTGNIDFYVSSTQAQTDLLATQFKKYARAQPQMVTIPVGALDVLRFPKGKRKPCSMLTASRLADEKHIDWLVMATAVAREQIPELTLDIFGEGVRRDDIAVKIKELQAESYVTLKGHHDLTAVYTDYELYLAGSTSEGFGLTLMEAVGSGLSLIGFDVPYGNQTFIDNGKNGFLIDYQEDQSADWQAHQLAEKIVAFFKQDVKAREKMQKHSYKKAEDYLMSAVAKKWAALIEQQVSSAHVL